MNKNNILERTICEGALATTVYLKMDNGALVEFLFRTVTKEIKYKRVIKNKRTYKAERYLKKYNDLINEVMEDIINGSEDKHKELLEDLSVRTKKLEISNEELKKELTKRINKKLEEGWILNLESIENEDVTNLINFTTNSNSPIMVMHFIKKEINSIENQIKRRLKKASLKK